MEQKIIRGLIGVFLIIGLWLRLSGTLHNNFAFNFDQGKDFLALYDIVYNHHFTLIGPSTGIDGVFHGVWWYYFLVPWYFIFGGSPKLVLIIFSLVCSSTILLSYFLGKTLINRKLGLIMAGLVSFSVFFIRTSVQIWHPFMLSVLILIFLILLWKFLHQQVSFFWIGLFLGLIFEFEFAAGGMFVLSFIITSIILKIKLPTRQFLWGLLGFFLIIVPRLIFELRHGFVQLKSLIAYLIKNQSQNHIFIFERFLNRIESFKLIFIEFFCRENKIAGTIFFIIFVFFCIFLLLLTKNPKLKKYYAIIISLLLVLFGLTVFYPDMLWNYYLLSLPVLFLPLVSIGIYYFINRFRYFGWLIYFLLIIYNLAPWTFWKTSIWEGDASTFKNEINVIDAIYQEANNVDFNVAVYSPSVIDYNYQYLFLWYGKKTYGYIPIRDREVKTVFYIIEPNQNHPTLPKMWLRERTGDGKIYWQSNFSGGIKVEKRIR